MNPSVSRLGEQTVMIQRCFGGTLDEYGNYHMMDVDPSLPRNHLLHLDEDLNVVSSAPILPPIDLPSPRFSEEGPIDLRLFAWRGELWCVGYIAEPTPGRRWLNQMLARIDRSGPASYCLADWRVLTPAGPRAHEKNWMPATSGDDLRFIYLCDPTRVLDDDAHVVSETVPRVAAEDFRGGSQAVSFDGGWLALIHQVAFQEARGRQYFHRFVWFDESWGLRRVSRHFFFRAKGVEFAAGLAWRPKEQQLLISFGVQDAESWIASVSADEVLRSLEDVENLSW